MRKATAFIMALTMVFALCACGGNEQSKSEQSSLISVMPREMTVIQPNHQVQTINLTDDTDYLEISKPKLTKVNGSIYRLSYDAKCVFPQELGVEYPNVIIIYHQYTDKDGNAVKSAVDYAYSFIYGQSLTMDAAVDTEAYLMQDYLLDISEVESIVFAKYEMKNLTASPSWLGDWQFINPVRFDIADLLPEEEISAAKEWAAKGIDPVQVELVQSENGEKSLRIVNSGDIKQESILIDYQMLDEDGDIIGTSNVWAHDLEVGQGTKQKLSPKNGVSAIKITGYVYPHNNGRSWTTTVEEVFSMKNPITLQIN